MPNLHQNATLTPQIRARLTNLFPNSDGGNRRLSVLNMTKLMLKKQVLLEKYDLLPPTESLLTCPPYHVSYNA